jgi:hypothetical protein
MILGTPKSLDEIPPLTVKTINELAAGMEQQIAAGTPPDVPAMMPMGQIAQFARTLKAYLAVSEALVALKGDDMDTIIEQLDALREEAQALLDTPEPPPPPRIQPARGTLITPK